MGSPLPWSERNNFKCNNGLRLMRKERHVTPGIGTRQIMTRSGLFAGLTAWPFSYNRMPGLRRARSLAAGWPKPNTRVTSRKVEPLDFAEWAKSEEMDAELKEQE